MSRVPFRARQVDKSLQQRELVQDPGVGWGEVVRFDGGEPVVGQIRVNPSQNQRIVEHLVNWAKRSFPASPRWGGVCDIAEAMGASPSTIKQIRAGNQPTEARDRLM